MTTKAIAVRQPARRLASMPARTESELRHDDLTSIHDVHRQLQGAWGSGILDKLSDAISRAEGLLWDDGVALLSSVIEAGQQPATKRDVAEQVALLIASYPSAAKIDPLLGRVFAEDVGCQHPTRGALAAACRKLRRTSKWLPSLSELLEALAAEEQRLADAPRLLVDMPRTVEQLKEQLASVVEWRRSRAFAEEQARLPPGHRELVDVLPRDAIVQPE